jgi:hypothetical protein
VYESLTARERWDQKLRARRRSSLALNGFRYLFRCKAPPVDYPLHHSIDAIWPISIREK